MHSRINTHMDRQLPAIRTEGLSIVFIYDRLGQVKFSQQIKIRRIGIAKNQDLPPDSRLAKLRSFRCGCHTVVSDAQLLKLLCHRYGPVPVRIRFHRRHQGAAVRKKFLKLLCIVVQMPGIQFNPSSAFFISIHRLCTAFLLFLYSIIRTAYK